MTLTSMPTLELLMLMPTLKLKLKILRGNEYESVIVNSYSAAFSAVDSVAG
jgi:hypothetical protein